MGKLTDKQKRFIQEYPVDFNGTQAAIRAGYSEKAARKISSELLTKPDIKEEIEKSKEKQRKNTDITIEELTDFFKKMMEDKEQRGADRLKAAENLARRKGYYEEDNKQLNPGSKPVTIKFTKK